MSESMNTAVKSISLDDIGDMQARGPKAAGKNANMMYSPAYKTGPSSLDLGHQSGTQEGTLTNFRPMGEQGGTSSFGTALTSMTRLFGGKFGLQDRARQFLIGGGLLLVIAFGFLWNQSTGTTSTLADLENLVAPLLGEGSIESPSEEPTSELDPVINEVNPTISTQVPTPVPTSGGLENPYWNIPNPLELGDKLGASGQLSPSQEERWRQGLQHPFTWQRFKTVSEMRQARLKGSQTLLNDALGQPKFWTRMEAVLGLAELGEEVDIDSVDKALGQARSTLIQNYFMRFRQNSNGGELYIMRQAIRLADAGSRLVILQNIIQNRNADNDLYLVAATFDPDQNIKSWIKQKLLAKPLDPQVIESFNKISATGEKTPTSTSNLNPPAPGTAPDLKNVSTAPKSNIDEIKVEQLSDKVNVEDVYFINNEEEGAEPLDKTAPPPDDGFEQLEKQ